MTQQTPMVFEVDASEVVLDRLAGPHQLIAPQLVRQALLDTGRRDRSDCRLTHEITLWVVLAMGILTDVPLRSVFKRARRPRKGEPSPPRNSPCKARRRLGVAPVRYPFSQVVRPLATPQTPGAFCKGSRLLGIDGTTYDLPDSPASVKASGRPKGPRADAAFPQLRKLSLVELGTHAELAFVLRPSWRGEINLAAGLMRHLGEGMLLLWGRNSFSHPLRQALTREEVGLLARAKGGPILEPIEALAGGSRPAKVCRDAHGRTKGRNGTVVRVIKYTLDDPQRVGHGEGHTLLTTLLGASEHPALTLILLHHERWEEELTFDEQKTHHDPARPGKPASVRSEAPRGVVQEMYALSPGRYVTRAPTAQAAATQDLGPDRLSFVGCLRILRCRLPECDSRTPQSWREWLNAVPWEMSGERVDAQQTPSGPQRYSRINPRVVKRKMSSWKKKRPEHRNRPRCRNPLLRR